MSAKKPSAKALKAREQAAKIRAQEAQAARRKKITAVSAAVVVVLVVAGLIGFAVYKGTRPEGPMAVPTAASSTGALAYGKTTAPTTVEIYADFQCPVCQQFEAQNGTTIEKAVDAGQVKVNFRPIAILNSASSGTKYSTRSAGAAACVADQSTDVLRKYITALYANQPEEGKSGLTDKKLIALAVTAGADKSKVSSCINDGTYDRWANKQTDDSSKKGVNGTPTILLNGKQLSDAERSQFSTLLASAIKTGSAK